MARPTEISPVTVEQYHKNLCPHINTITWSTLRFVLQAEGFKYVGIRVGNEYSWPRKLSYILPAIPVRLYCLFSSRNRREKLGLHETSCGEVLYGGSRIAIVARRARAVPSGLAASPAHEAV